MTKCADGGLGCSSRDDAAPDMGLDALGGWVLDVGALVAFARSDMFVSALVASCRRRGQTVLICETSLALAVQAVPEQHDRLVGLCQEPNTWLAKFAAADSGAVAALLPAASGDIGLAQVVYEAARRGYAVLSDRRASVLAIDGSLLVEAA
ncbi:hypothetical protein AB0B57_35810 [Micromonospora sp. NPDC049101]|uniref:hypothetical protein n=1 Tax=unclassified Micromonospora TaxID=2617518 RepID=UPI003411F4DB